MASRCRVAIVDKCWFLSAGTRRDRVTVGNSTRATRDHRAAYSIMSRPNGLRRIADGIWVAVSVAVTKRAASNQFSVCLATLPFCGVQPGPQKLDDRSRDAGVIEFTQTQCQGGHDGHRYREVFQYSKRLWIHRAERRQQGRVRAHQRGRARRHAHAGRRPEGSYDIVTLSGARRPQAICKPRSRRLIGPDPPEAATLAFDAERFSASALL